MKWSTPVALAAISDSYSPVEAPPLSATVLAEIATSVARIADRWEDQLDGHPTQRTGMRLMAAEEYDVWMLRWPFGTSVDPHDHGESTGAFSVVSGELAEVRWPDGSQVIRAVVPGETVTIERGVVHDVIGVSADSVSIHVYSPPLRTMSFYDDRGVEVVDRLEVDEAGPTVGVSQLLHPSRGR